MGVGMGRKILWDAGAPPPWDGGVADPLETRFSALQGHSMPLEPTRIDRLPVTSY